MADQVTGFLTTHNQPTPLNHFVGRERELEEVQKLLSACRLLTLTGPSGCGKTRLAVETVRSLAASYLHGAWLVDFSLIDDPRQVFTFLANALNVANEDGRPLETVLLEYLRKRRLLLILDNCEHVIEEAARTAAAVLSSAPAIKILATSQVPLGIPGEVEWIVPSLSIAASSASLTDMRDPRQNAGPVAFCERAAEVLPGFSLNDANNPIILEICRRLDGIPLALELAAARVKMLSLEEINARLDDRFSLLVSSRRVTGRHQTLQAAIDWSYALLTPPQHCLLNRLGIFRGPWTLQAAEAVGVDAGCSGTNILSLLAELVDRSWVVVLRPIDGNTRYRLLESVRLYALARLSSEEQANLRDLHLRFYTRLAQQADGHVHDAGQIYWNQQLEQDLPNMLSAIEWAAQALPPEPRLLLGLQLGSAIGWYFRGRSTGNLVHSWLEKLVNQAEETPGPEWTAARAQAANLLGRYYWLRSSYLNAIKYSRKQPRTMGKPGAGTAGGLRDRHLLPRFHFTLIRD